MNGEDNQKNLTVHPSDQAELPSSHPKVEPQTPRWRQSVVPAVIGLVLLGGLGWIIFSRFILPMMMGGQMAPPPTPVPLANPKSAPIQDSSDYSATLDSRQSVTLQPRVAGQISAIYVQPGDRVEAGQPILEIDADQQRAQVSSRTAAALTAAADVQAAQADVANAADTLRSLEAQRAAALANVQLNQQEYQRYQELTRQGASSQQTLDQRANALRTAQAELRQAEAEIQAQRSAIGRTQSVVTRNQRAVEEAEANIAEGQAALEEYTITAPFSGTVSNIPVKVGDAVTVGTQLLNITQNKQLEVQIQLPLERASSARLGLPVKLLDDQNREIQTGRISFIAPNVDATTQSVQVEATFENGSEVLRSSQFVRARVIWSSQPGVLVPTTAISRLGGRDFLFVAAPFKDSGCQAPASEGTSAPVDPDQLVAAQKPVKLGRIVNNDQEVLEGVMASDRIVVSGILQLQNCMPIADAASSTSPPAP
ncbi:MAG: efflux RND transporter periplasmic adaptor subunit [Timaviella obliquedivisa GSE-PSE-MK23-08B]|jgi:RND family efflux transporter MFP subunit|nr:efflux RND transporter periplasmic adaptor subunit [Timaviella obliquedivisa GSE-PSE-MK23-08B]